MPDNNPDYTASAVVTQVESDLRNPNLGTAFYLPHISAAFGKVRQKLERVGQQAKEDFFGDVATINLTTDSPAEFDLTTVIPRFGGFIGVQVKYGGADDQYNPATKLKSFAHWANWDHISSVYRGKDQPLYYKRGDTIGFIPVPPEPNATAKVWFVKRGFQVTDGGDELDIPYRFMYPILTYVKARAIERANEDYVTAAQLDRRFEAELEDIAQAAASEFNEEDGDSVEIDSNDALYSDPFFNR